MFDIDKLLDECTFVASRSSGSGGQNVNKVSTKITLQFDVDASEILTEEQKQRVKEKLKTRINKAGMLQINSDKERTQFLNKKNVIEKFTTLLQKACKEEKDRIATKPTSTSKQKRKEEKIRLSIKKESRSNWNDTTSL